VSALPLPAAAPKGRPVAPPHGSTEAARAAGLRYVDPDTTPGLARVRRRGGFAYVDANGRPVRDAATLERIRKLVVPPAWRDVWICPVPNGHIQAVGRDARGRKQYRYHARWREVRDATKYHRVLAFSRALPRIRRACERDLARPGLPREKVLATAVRLLELTHMRIGNEEYARENGSYGLTTLRDRHVRVEGGRVVFRFRGKAGKVRELDVRDRRLAGIIGKCSELPGHELFQYVDDGGALRTIDSGDVNRYIRAAAGGEEFTAKDFRTWAGTVLAARTLRALEPCAGRGRANKNVVSCVKAVAARLGNTPAVCKRCYVHPAVLESYLDGTLRRVRARDDEELVRAVLARAERTSDAARLDRALRASVRLAARVARARGRS